jgi:hypothetical protein
LKKAGGSHYGAIPLLFYINLSCCLLADLYHIGYAAGNDLAVFNLEIPKAK